MTYVLIKNTENNIYFILFLWDGDLGYMLANNKCPLM